MPREPFDEIDDKIRDWVEGVVERCQFDDTYSHRVEPVPGQSYDGFFAYTAGGYDGLIYGDMSIAYGSGSVPKAIQPYLDRSLKDCEEEWDRQNPDHTLAWISEEPDANQLALLPRPSHTDRDVWQEKFYEFEHDWLSEGGTYFYKVRALYLDNDTVTKQETGAPEVLFCVGINTDFEYGRDNIPWLRYYGANPQQTEWVWEKTVKVADITEALLDQLEDEAAEALRHT